jgi:hypothetical protein
MRTRKRPPKWFVASILLGLAVASLLLFLAFASSWRG